MLVAISSPLWISSKRRRPKNAADSTSGVQRYEYRLTQKGRDLFPHALMLMQWGDRWLAPAGGPNLRVFHKPCGARLNMVACSHCHKTMILQRHLPAGGRRGRRPARGRRGLARSFTLGAASKSSFSPIASIIWARSSCSHQP